jgi:eukaryotic-like serine/threonine-protein kinase
MDTMSLDDAADPLCGREVAGGRYLVERVLGKGGMGTVYAALQRPINRRVALKLIHRELTGNREIVERFLQEMRLTAAIEHPHTVRLYDFGDIEGQPFLTTEFLEGRTLRAELTKVGALGQARVATIGIQIAKALRAAHEHAVVHRDLKPDNIMLLDSYGERDYVKVLDFGIARSLGQTTDLRTRTGTLLGTPAYMSPEQCDGRPVDARSDLYSLGIVLYEMATGVTPFPPSHTLPQLLMDHVSVPPPDVRTCAVGLAEPVASLIMSLLGKQPDQRPTSAEAVVTALAPFATVTQPQMGVAQTVAAIPQPTPTAPTVARPAAVASVHPVVRPIRGAKVASFAVLAGVVALAAGWWIFSRGTSVSAEAIAAALSTPGEPPFPKACVSERDRPQVLAAATGKAGWGAIPADRNERLWAEARVPGVADTDAVARLEKLVSACPDFAGARTLLGKALARLNRDAEAIDHLKKANQLAPHYLTARFALAVALSKQGDSQQALPLVSAVLTEQPGHAGALLLRGQLRLSSGDARGAVEDLKAHVAAQPTAGAAWAMLGEALTRLSDQEGARAAFCRAVDLGVERVRERCPAAPQGR